MIEDMLRETFARHEGEAPGTTDLRRAIERRAAQRKRRRAMSVAGGLAAGVAVLVIGVSVVVRTLGPAATSLPQPVGGVPDRALNFLVLGIDDAPGLPAPYRSDSITVVHITEDRQHIYLIDFERDTKVDIPGHGTGKINASYELGGAGLTATVVSTLTGVTLDGVVVVTPAALAGLVDAVGELHVCLPHGLTSIHTGHTYPVGCYGLDGAAAADIVRQRVSLPLGGYERDANIQRVMVALVRQAASLNLFTDAGKIASMLAVDGLTVDMPGISPVALAADLAGRSDEDVTGIVAPNFNPASTNGQEYFEMLDPVVTPELFEDLRDDTLDQFAAAHPAWLIG